MSLCADSRKQRPPAVKRATRFRPHRQSLDYSKFHTAPCSGNLLGYRKLDFTSEHSDREAGSGNLIGYPTRGANLLTVATDSRQGPRLVSASRSIGRCFSGSPTFPLGTCRQRSFRRALMSSSKPGVLALEDGSVFRGL